MKILLAPDSFKESLPAKAVCRAIEQGIHRADPSIACDSCPMGDGGQGTMDAIIAAAGGTMHQAGVLDPLGKAIQAHFGVMDDGRIAIIELAQASGLQLVPPGDRDPTRTTTFGSGQLIRAAQDRGCTAIILCLGGSATIDGGMGLIQALGGEFLDSRGRPIAEPLTGGMLASVAKVSPPPNVPRIRVVCDVTNPLCGPNGAAAIYGPQKGATPEQISRLDAGLARLASLIGGDPDQPGAGAAGGAGYGLATLCGASLERGIDLVLEMTGFDRRVRDAALVLTGEGRLDAQSLMGKTCLGISRAAHQRGVPTIAIVGDTGPGAERCVDPEQGLLKGYVSLTERFGRERAWAEPKELIALVAAGLFGIRAPGRAE